MSHYSGRPRHQPIYRIDVWSNRECDTHFAAPPVDDNDIRVTALPNDGGYLYTSPTAWCRGQDIRACSSECGDSVREYNTASDKGLWVIFLDGMRWYPRSDTTELVLKVGAGDSSYVPQFINDNGEWLSHREVRGDMLEKPVFTFMSRRRTLDSDSVSMSSRDETLGTAQVKAYIRDGRDGLMAVHNGRMMIWLAGSRGDPPLRHWELLRDYAGIVNTATSLEALGNPGSSGELPSIRCVACEIGVAYPYRHSR